MDLLAVVDGFASTSPDPRALPAASDHPPSLPHRPDKGKARACDDSDDDSQKLQFSLAESSRSAHSRPAWSSSTSHHPAATSADPSHRNAKGKSRLIPSDSETNYWIASPISQMDDRATASSSTSHSRYERPSLITADSQCAPYEELSLKRSIREMASSPSSSPRHQSHLLPAEDASGSSSALGSPNNSFDVSLNPAMQSSSHSGYALPSTANKKRRSFRRHNSDHQSLAHGSEPPAASSSTVVMPRIHTPVQVEPHAHRTSLLVNSSTRDIHPLAPGAALCLSPEPLDSAARSDHSRADLSHRRTAFLDSARAQRSSSLIRRRRAFYIRDNDLLRNDPPQHSQALVDRPSSSTSDTFMAEFTRAVDLRLSSRAESTHDSRLSPNAANALRTEHLHSSRDQALQPTAPQLPYVRTASPLTLSFAADEANGLGHNAPRPLASQNLRRRIPAPFSDRSLSSLEFSASTALSRSIALSWSTLPCPHLSQSPSTYLSERSPDASPTAQASSHRYPSSHREDAGRTTETRRHEPPLAAATMAPERPESWRQPFRLRVSAQTREHAAVDDFGAVQRPFGLRGSRSSRSIFRTRVEADSRPDSNTTNQAESLRNNSSRADARRSEEAHNQPHISASLRSQFALRMASELAEPNVSTAQARFDPFGASPRLDARQTSGFESARGRLSSSLSRERYENESALEYLGRLMTHDTMLDEGVDGDVRGPLLRMAFESEASHSHALPRLFEPTPASSSNTFGHPPHLSLDARNFIADEDWAELNSYEGLTQLSERLGAAEICVPQSLIDTLPTCEYGKWDGGSCRQRDASCASPLLVGKGKGKQKVERAWTARDTMCPICREDYLDSDMLMSINKCCHAFHADCIRVSVTGMAIAASVAQLRERCVCANANPWRASVGTQQTWFKTAKTCPLCRADAFDQISLGLPALTFESSSTLAFDVEHRWVQ